MKDANPTGEVDTNFWNINLPDCGTAALTLFHQVYMTITIKSIMQRETDFVQVVQMDGSCCSCHDMVLLFATI